MPYFGSTVVTELKEFDKCFLIGYSSTADVTGTIVLKYSTVQHSDGVCLTNLRDMMSKRELNE